jgi:hypothetical protein
MRSFSGMDLSAGGMIRCQTSQLEELAFASEECVLPASLSCATANVGEALIVLFRSKDKSLPLLRKG